MSLFINPDGLLTTKTPTNLTCEARRDFPPRAGQVCGDPATYIYGPECEAETGRLIYLCNAHATLIKDWRAGHLYDPVECPQHGRIGTVKESLVLKSIPHKPQGQ